MLDATPLCAPTPSSISPYGELRCVLAVIRHGDRTPKQKMKMKVTQEPLLALLHKHLDSKGKQAKLKVGGWAEACGCDVDCDNCSPGRAKSSRACLRHSQQSRPSNPTSHTALRVQHCPTAPPVPQTSRCLPLPPPHPAEPQRAAGPAGRHPPAAGRAGGQAARGGGGGGGRRRRARPRPRH